MTPICTPSFHLKANSVLAEIKYICDNDLGIQTQCIKGKNAKRPNAQLLANLCMKINAKVGGTNFHFGDYTADKFYRQGFYFDHECILVTKSETNAPAGYCREQALRSVEKN